MEKKNIELGKIIKFLNGLNIITNAGASVKDVETAFNISIFKAEAQKLFEAFQAASASSTEQDEAKKKEELEKLLDKKYDIEMPVITLEMLKESKAEIPLLAFDYLGEFITKK